MYFGFRLLLMPFFAFLIDSSSHLVAQFAQVRIQDQDYHVASFLKDNEYFQFCFINLSRF